MLQTGPADRAVASMKEATAGTAGQDYRDRGQSQGPLSVTKARAKITKARTRLAS